MTAKEELDFLLGQVEKTPLDSEAWYNIGRLEWKLGNRGKAISAYNKSYELDPDGPACVALEQARQIMDFYNKDLYNP